MIYKYFKEIKNRVILIITMYMFLAIILFIYKELVIYIVIKPCFSSLFKNSLPYFISTNITELINIYILVIIKISNIFCVIHTFFHLIKFLKPALYYKEKLILNNICVMLFISTCIFNLLFYTYLIPNFVNILFSFYEVDCKNKVGIPIFLEYKLIDYVEIYFEVYNISLLGIIIFTGFIVTTINKIKNENFKILKIRRISHLGLLIISTLITPPDVISQLTLGLLLVIVYEAILVIYLIFSNIKSKI